MRKKKGKVRKGGRGKVREGKEVRGSRCEGSKEQGRGGRQFITGVQRQVSLREILSVSDARNVRRTAAADWVANCR